MTLAGVDSSVWSYSNCLLSTNHTDIKIASQPWLYVYLGCQSARAFGVCCSMKSLINLPVIVDTVLYLLFRKMVLNSTRLGFFLHNRTLFGAK